MIGGALYLVTGGCCCVGVASALVSTLCAVGSDWDAAEVFAHVEADNDGARGLYQRCGFTELEERCARVPIPKHLLYMLLSYKKLFSDVANKVPCMS